MPLKGKENVKDAVEHLTLERDKQLRAIFLTGLRNIALGTPADEGRARNSWFFSAKSPQSSGDRSANKSATSSLRGASTMPKSVFGRRMFYVNNMPYINKLEYGGFPNPAKNGTWVKGKGYEKRTVGGYSDQAPGGWVRGELLKMRKRIRDIK